MNAQQLRSLEVTVVGGGMITHDQILPSLYQLQRAGLVGRIKVCALNSAPLRALAGSGSLKEAFPERSFEPFPPLDAPDDAIDADLFRKVIAEQGRHQLVVVAVPDHVHNGVIQTALDHDQHVVTVKPLVPRYAEAVAIERKAAAKGLFVGVEYHKRFDRRSLDARRQYRAGRFGEFRAGEAKMIEPYYYRHSNFQNWFTKENSDPFTYVGCHYVDLVYFITGLKPVEVSVRGVEGAFPNGKIGYMWAAGRVVWENGAVMSVTDGLGYPDQAAGTNDQCLAMYCEGEDCGAVLRHNDQFRGVEHGYVDDASGAKFRYVSPDYFRLVPYDGPGCKPVGYGFESVEALVLAAAKTNFAGEGLEGDAALAARQECLAQIDERGLLATPANSWINELVTEAARMSIVRDGIPVTIQYGPSPQVRVRT